MASKSAESLNTSGNMTDSEDELTFFDADQSNSNEPSSVQEKPSVQGVQRSSCIAADYGVWESEKAAEENEKNEIRTLVSGILEQSLTDIGQKSESYSVESESRTESEISETLGNDTSQHEISPHDSGEVKASSGQTNRIYSTSSFCKDAAGFLEERTQDTTNHNKDISDVGFQRKRAATIANEDPFRRETRKSHYDQYARSKSVPENKMEKIPRNILPRTESGTIDFISKNKYLVSSNPDHLLQQHPSKKRLKTATKRKEKMENENGRKESIVTRENKKQGRSESLAPATGEWAELNESQFASFRKLFSRFDQSQSGGISAEELFAAIREFMPEEEISFGIVQKVHAELDIKQTGEIEFDEFLFAMTNPKNYMKLINDDDRKQLTKEIELWEEFQEKKKQHRMALRARKKENEQNTENGNGNNIFFTMLRTATKKESMREIRHFYLNKIKKLNDHVIHDWSAGQRCIGLSDQSVLKRYEHIMRELNNKKSPFAKDKIYQKSPYAIPLYWGLSELKIAESKRKSVRDEKLYKHVRSAIESEKEKRRKSEHVNEFGIRRVQSAKNRDEIKPDSNRSDQKVSSKKVKILQVAPRRRSKLAVRSDVYRAYSAPPTDIKIATTQEKKDVKKKARSAPPRRVKISEFVVTPKVVPLPRYEIKNNPAIFDYDHLEEIRKSAADILQEYYNKLKKVSATNSKVVYKKLQVHQISPILQKHFKKSYLAYSGECEPFVVSPWIPYPTPTPWMQKAPLGQSCRARSAWT